MNSFEEQIKKDLHQYLLSLQEVDERMPQCPDVEEKWEKIAQAYVPDGIREFNAYPTASLGWMMYIGMALAKYWDEEWEIYSKIEDLYAYMDSYTSTEKLVGECASRVYNALLHQRIESGTKEAFNAYVVCLHQLYLMGAYIQLKRMGYHMTAIN